MLKEKVKKTIEEHTLIQRGDHIVLGLSGGPDSVCLFHVLRQIASEMDLSIHAVHVNHKFRPEAAENDQAYVEEICAKAMVPCETFVVDCNALAKERGLTPEEAGREARYEAFYKTASDIKKKLAEEAEKEIHSGSQVKPEVLIAVAQNANDQAETIIQRIIRGTGPDGLAGIAYKRYEKDIPVIRPLLDVSRKEIEEYCSENKLDPVRDHTNFEPVYLRNRIRLELLPLLEEYNSNIIEGLGRLARIASADRQFMEKITAEGFSQSLVDEPLVDVYDVDEDDVDEAGSGPIVLDRARLAALDDPIRHRVVKLAFEKIGLTQDITEERLIAADAIIMKKQGPKTVEFPHGYRLKVEKGRVLFIQ